jgi:ribonucleoside-diphosphate reductase alpha chain
MAACQDPGAAKATPLRSEAEPRAEEGDLRGAHRDGRRESTIQRTIQFARQGFTAIEFRTYDTDWDSEAYLTVSGQNSNNSVRVTNDFLHAVENDATGI